MLGFYLASWGMYRGSSFLLQNSHEIHTPILKIIFDKQYEQLWNQTDFSETTEECLILLFLLKDSIAEQYRNETHQSQRISDTLITKIILGVIGITPAYDRYLKDGCKMKDITPFSNFTKNSYLSLINFYLENREAFNQAESQIFEISRIKYPPMKLIDMYLWSLGRKNT